MSSSSNVKTEKPETRMSLRAKAGTAATSTDGKSPAQKSTSPITTRSGLRSTPKLKSETTPKLKTDIASASKAVKTESPSTSKTASPTTPKTPTNPIPFSIKTRAKTDPEGAAKRRIYIPGMFSSRSSNVQKDAEGNLIYRRKRSISGSSSKDEPPPKTRMGGDTPTESTAPKTRMGRRESVESRSSSPSLSTSEPPMKRLKIKRPINWTPSAKETKTVVDDSGTIQIETEYFLITEQGGSQTYSLTGDKKNDFFCWICTKEGDLFCCELCPRVYHAKCLNVENEPEGAWVCPECRDIMTAECSDTKSKSMSLITVDQLCLLLRYALGRMKCQGSEIFQKPVDPTVVPEYKDYVLHPMDLSSLEKNIKRKMYGSTEAFLSDTKWILHNCVIFNGEKDKLTGMAKTIIKICKHEMNEIEICPDCYFNSCTKKNNEWFCEPCRIPHPLVWAKMKGYPYWPAKALREVKGQVDVRFFGEHDRAWCHITQVFLLSKNPPAAILKSKKGIEESVKEMNIHIKKIKAKFGSFAYAPHRTLYKSNNPRSSTLDSKSSSKHPKKSKQEETPRSKMSSLSKPKSVATRTASQVRNKYNLKSGGSKIHTRGVSTSHHEVASRESSVDAPNEENPVPNQGTEGMEKKDDEIKATTKAVTASSVKDILMGGSGDTKPSDEKVKDEDNVKDSDKVTAEKEVTDVNNKVSVEKEDTDKAKIANDVKDVDKVPTENEVKDTDKVIAENEVKDKDKVTNENEEKNKDMVTTENEAKDTDKIASEKQVKVITENESTDLDKVTAENEAKDTDKIITDNKAKDADNALTETQTSGTEKVITDNEANDTDKVLTENENNGPSKVTDCNNSKDATGSDQGTKVIAEKQDKDTNDIETKDSVDNDSSCNKTDIKTNEPNCSTNDKSTNIDGSNDTNREIAKEKSLDNLTDKNNDKNPVLDSTSQTTSLLENVESKSTDNLHLQSDSDKTQHSTNLQDEKTSSTTENDETVEAGKQASETTNTDKDKKVDTPDTDETPDTVDTPDTDETKTQQAAANKEVENKEEKSADSEKVNETGQDESTKGDDLPIGGDSPLRDESPMREDSPIREDPPIRDVSPIRYNSPPPKEMIAASPGSVFLGGEMDTSETDLKLHIDLEEPTPLRVSKPKPASAMSFIEKMEKKLREEEEEEEKLRNSENLNENNSGQNTEETPQQTSESTETSQKIEQNADGESKQTDVNKKNADESQNEAESKTAETADKTDTGQTENVSEKSENVPPDGNDKKNEEADENDKNDDDDSQEPMDSNEIDEPENREKLITDPKKTDPFLQKLVESCKEKLGVEEGSSTDDSDSSANSSDDDSDTSDSDESGDTEKDEQQDKDGETSTPKEKSKKSSSKKVDIRRKKANANKIQETQSKDGDAENDTAKPDSSVELKCSESKSSEEESSVRKSSDTPKETVVVSNDSGDSVVKESVSTGESQSSSQNVESENDRIQSESDKINQSENDKIQSESDKIQPENDKIQSEHNEDGSLKSPTETDTSLENILDNSHENSSLTNSVTEISSKSAENDNCQTEPIDVSKSLSVVNMASDKEISIQNNLTTKSSTIQNKSSLSDSSTMDADSGVLQGVGETLSGDKSKDDSPISVTQDVSVENSQPKISPFVSQSTELVSVTSITSPKISSFETPSNKSHIIISSHPDSQRSTSAPKSTDREISTECEIVPASQNKTKVMTILPKRKKYPKKMDEPESRSLLNPSLVSKNSKVDTAIDLDSSDPDDSMDFDELIIDLDPGKASNSNSPQTTVLHSASPQSSVPVVTSSISILKVSSSSAVIQSDSSTAKIVDSSIAISPSIAKSVTSSTAKSVTSSIAASMTSSVVQSVTSSSKTPTIVVAMKSPKVVTIDPKGKDLPKTKIITVGPEDLCKSKDNGKSDKSGAKSNQGSKDSDNHGPRGGTIPSFDKVRNIVGTDSSEILVPTLSENCIDAMKIFAGSHDFLNEATGEMGDDPVDDDHIGGFSMDDYVKTINETMMQTMTKMAHDIRRRCVQSIKSGPSKREAELEKEVEDLRYLHQKELEEMQHTNDIRYAELQMALEVEHDKRASELNDKLMLDKDKTIAEVKRKQWCANCSKEAIFYCCWNTSYCNYPCQKAHWPKHMATCTQSQHGDQNPIPDPNPEASMGDDPGASTSGTNSPNLNSKTQTARNDLSQALKKQELQIPKPPPAYTHINPPISQVNNFFPYQNPQFMRGGGPRLPMVPNSNNQLVYIQQPPRGSPGFMPHGSPAGFAQGAPMMRMRQPMPGQIVMPPNARFVPNNQYFPTK